MIKRDPRIDPTPAREFVAVLPVEEAVEAVENAAMELVYRQAMREPRPRSGPPARCSACCRFNLALAWRWATGRETDGDREFARGEA